ncbi:MAG TPA: hypothetical protein VOA64_11680 [Candidatus Dormibacteraeota bacterium]|nr:hypothetical protein [Candidatus Dormibacteraeota bacterium]
MLRTSESGAYSEAPLGKDASIPDRAADAVVHKPQPARQIDAALKHQILGQSA